MVGSTYQMKLIFKCWDNVRWVHDSVFVKGRKQGIMKLEVGGVIYYASWPWILYRPAFACSFTCEFKPHSPGSPSKSGLYPEDHPTCSLQRKQSTTNLLHSKWWDSLLKLNNISHVWQILNQPELVEKCNSLNVTYHPDLGQNCKNHLPSSSSNIGNYTGLVGTSNKFGRNLTFFKPNLAPVYIWLLLWRDIMVQ